MSVQAPKNVFKAGLLRWALNCSVTALVLSIVSIAMASYALSFNVLPIRYASYFSQQDQDSSINSDFYQRGRKLISDTNKVREMQSSFLSNFYWNRKRTDDTTIIFQSIPLCGGDILPGLVKKLFNGDGLPIFHHVAEFTEEYPSLPNVTNSLAELEKFMTKFIATSTKPLFLFIERGSVPIIEASNIYYISLICDPAYRLIETYRMDHMGDDMQYVFPPGLRKTSKSLSFEECFKQRNPECYGQHVQAFTVQHFCNNTKACSSPNLNDQLDIAISVAKYYQVIGSLEEFNLFLKLIEKDLPDYFSGISNIFAQDDDFEAFRTKRGPLEGASEPNITSETFKKLKGHIWPDYGFYWKIRKLFS